MLVYFAASTAGIARYKNQYKHLLRTLKSLHVDMVDNWFICKLRGVDKYKDPADSLKSEIKLMVQSDVFIAEVSIPSFGVASAIYQALTQKKPVICLFREELDKSLISDVFLGSYYENIHFELYNNKNIREVLTKNLESLEVKGLTKFNFLISPEISHYLDWVTKDANISKSEYLRDAVVKNIIKKDSLYTDYLKEKRKGPK